MARSPTMVVATEFWSGGSGRGLAEGFRALGWGVQEVDWNHLGGRHGNDLVLRGLGRLTASRVRALYRDRILEACRTLRPDVFLTFKGFGVDRELLAAVRAEGARTVMVYPDVAFHHGGVDEASFGGYDLFVTTKRFHVPYLLERCPDLLVLHIDHGYSSAVHRQWLGTPRDDERPYAVMHAGTRSAYKADYLQALMGARPSFEVSVVGNGWNALPTGPRALGERTGIAYALSIQRARINVALMYGPVPGGWQDDVSTRTFEIPACGGFMLHIDSAEVRDLYDVGNEIDVFASVEELADKIDFYLPRPELRDAMIARAYERCVPAYSYDRRAETIAAELRRL